MNLTLDIETLPTESAAVIADITAGIRPPANLKKADTIAKWEAEEKPQAIEDAIRKTAFDGTYGRVLAIGYAVNDQAPICLIGGELETLQAFVSDLKTISKLAYHGGETEKGITFIGHNIAGFDLRFLWQRMVVNNIRPTVELLGAMKARPWDKSIADTMTMWNPDRQSRVSLDKLCKALGVPTPKGGMDGSKVYETYKAGDLEKIRTYCMADVDAVRECYRRLTFADPIEQRKAA